MILYCNTKLMYMYQYLLYTRYMVLFFFIKLHHIMQLCNVALLSVAVWVLNVLIPWIFTWRVHDIMFIQCKKIFFANKKSLLFKINQTWRRSYIMAVIKGNAQTQTETYVKSRFFNFPFKNDGYRRVMNLYDSHLFFNKIFPH